MIYTIYNILFYLLFRHFTSNIYMHIKSQIIDIDNIIKSIY